MAAIRRPLRKIKIGSMTARLTVSVLLIATAALGGCAVAPHSAPSPSLQLLESAPLTLAAGCPASGSYIVGFTVDMQGRTTDIAPPAAPPCVREALAEWAATFRFAPPATPTPGSVEWLLVTAPRGS